MMSSARIVALLATLPAINPIGPTAAAPMTNWPFALPVMRFKSPDCGEALSPEGVYGGVHVKQGTCHTRDDGKNFVSFTYQWEKYTDHQEMLCIEFLC